MAALKICDARTVTGSNVALIEGESGLDVGQATIHQFGTCLVAARPEVPVADVWRLSYLEKLLKDRDNDCMQHEKKQRQCGSQGMVKKEGGANSDPMLLMLRLSTYSIHFI